MVGIRTGWACLSLVIGVTLVAHGAAGVVVFSDDFEGSVATSSSRWGSASSTGLTLTSDVPPSSPGDQSIRLDSGAGKSTFLFHRLPANYSRLFYRYYVKYNGTEYHHTGAMIGGYEPPTNWPQGDAGLKGVRPNGDRLVVVNLEAYASRFDTYMNWIDMQGATYQGVYYGRNMLQDLALPVPSQWTCVEMMVSLNSPATATNGELTIWIDGDEVASFRPGTPNGYWDGIGHWRMRSGSPPFTGFRWRDTTALGLNWVKIDSYDSTPRVWFDDVVVATERIGCLPEPTQVISLACGVTLLAGLARRRSRLTRRRALA